MSKRYPFQGYEFACVEKWAFDYEFPKEWVFDLLDQSVMEMPMVSVDLPDSEKEVDASQAQVSESETYCVNGTLSAVLVKAFGDKGTEDAMNMGFLFDGVGCGWMVSYREENEEASFYA